jgi:nucleotide-binding universal stress UspA family protein
MLSGMQHILVGVDGSPESLEAVAWTAELARRLGCEVIAATVLGFNPSAAIPSGVLPMDGDWVEAWRRDLRRDLDGAWTKSLRAAGVPATTLVEDGRPADVLDRLAREHAVDLIVVGNRGHGAVAGMLLGSVSHTLAINASCPVVVMPHHRDRHDRGRTATDSG